MSKTHKPYEFVAVDLWYKDTTKDPITVAVVHRSADLKDWMDEHLPPHKITADVAMIFTYNVTVH